MRAYSFLQGAKGKAAEYDTGALPMLAVTEKNAHFAAMMDQLLPTMPRVLEAPATGLPRELLVMRLVSASDLASQTYEGNSAMGFGVLHVTKKTDARAYANAQINKTTFFVNRGSNVFTNVRTVDLDRNVRMKPHDPENPLQKLYVW